MASQCIVRDISWMEIGFNGNLIEDTHGLISRFSFDLIHAVRKGDLEKIMKLISENPHWDEHKFILCEAIDGDHEIAKLLISQGADVNSVSRGLGASALTHAVKVCNKELVRMLIDKGANVYDRNLDDSTALHWACKLNRLDIALLLIIRGASINASTYYDDTPFTISIVNNNITMIDTFVEYGADVNAKSENGFPPLHIAVENSHLDTIKCLLTKNVNLHARDNYNRDALYLAIIRADKEIVHHLIEAGASIHTYYNHEDGVETPLHVALYYDRGPIVEMLLSKGADPLSAYNVRIDTLCVTNYVGEESNMMPIHRAAYRGEREICKKLLMDGANVNARTAHGFTPLHLATRYGHYEVVQDLLNGDADINAATNNGLTSLHLAARAGTPHMTNLLLERQANVNARDINGLTPLHLAAEKGKVENVRVILNYRPDIDAVDVNGNTALHFGIDSVAIVLALLCHGCDVNIENDHDDTPIRLVWHNDELCLSIKRYCLQKWDPHRYDFTYTRKYYKQINAFMATDVFCHLMEVLIAGAQMADINISNLRLLSHHGCNCECNADGNNYDEELEKMKTTKIDKTNVTFYDILTEPMEKVIQFVRNENVMDAITKHNLHQQFLVYKHLIKARFDKAMTQQKLLVESAKFFSPGIIPELRVGLPDHCVEKVFSHLHNKDLSNLKDIFETAYTTNVKRKRIKTV